MLAKTVENADHEGPRVDNLLEARPFAEKAECIFAGSDQRSATEALETGIYATVLGNKLLLMARFDADPHDIKCRHVVLPTLEAHKIGADSPSLASQH